MGLHEEDVVSVQAADTRKAIEYADQAADVSPIVTDPIPARSAAPPTVSPSSSPAASPTLAPCRFPGYVFNPDMIDYMSSHPLIEPSQRNILATISLSTEEEADNRYYESETCARVKQYVLAKFRVSYFWPGLFLQQGGRPVHFFYAPQGTAPSSNLVTQLYELGLTGNGRQSNWFKVWSYCSELRQRPGFIYRTGDIINFTGGHTAIVVGDNTWNDVIVSHMSYNRTRQSYGRGQTSGRDFEQDFDPRVFDDYGVTRDRLPVLLQTWPCTTNNQEYPRVYRLMPWLTPPAPQFRQLNQLRPQNHNSYRSHTVRRGDILSRIAEKYEKSVDDLAEANGIPDINRIQTGDELLIPPKH